MGRKIKYDKKRFDPSKNPLKMATERDIRRTSNLWSASQVIQLKNALNTLPANTVFNLDGLPLSECSGLSCRVQDKQSDDILNVLRWYCTSTQREKDTNDAPIDKWFDIADALHPESFSLNQQMTSALCVAAEEPIESEATVPLNVDLPMPDFNNCYRYLAHATAGKELPELSPIDALLIEDCIQSLTEQIKTLNDVNLRQYLRKAYSYLTEFPTSGEEPSSSSTDPLATEVTGQLEKFANIFNPFGINPNSIIAVPPDAS